MLMKILSQSDQDLTKYVDEFLKTDEIEMKATE